MLDRRRTILLSLGLLSCFAAVTVAERIDAPSQSKPPVVVKNQGFLPFADAPINYRSAELDDPIARLEGRLERGEVKLRYDPGHGYLRSVLDALHVPVSSQTLVFAKTSFQFPQINPAHPRALRMRCQRTVSSLDGPWPSFILAWISAGR